ncbi:putative L-lactate dehydrogenase [compost metagenome]
MVLSGASLTRMEEVSAAAPGSWFQAHLTGDTAKTAALVERVADAGYPVLVVTVDIPVLANRENNVRNGFYTPLRPSVSLAWQGISHPRWTASVLARTLLTQGMPRFENSYAEPGAPIISSKVERELGKRDQLDWSIIKHIRERWKGTLVVKGVLRPDDARQALAVGADAIIVSNHGGRQLDGAISPIRALPAIVEQVAGAVPVMLDGGIRRGTDVLKALALGAAFVFVGRPFIYAAAVGGEAGVGKAIEILTNEIALNMGLLGITSIEEAAPDLVLKVA